MDRNTHSRLEEGTVTFALMSSCSIGVVVAIVLTMGMVDGPGCVRGRQLID